MGKVRKGGPARGTVAAPTALPKQSSPRLWLYSAESCQLSLCPLELGGIRQVSCSRGHLAVVLSNGSVALCGTENAGASETTCRKPKLVTLRKARVEALHCGESIMLLLAADGRLFECDYPVVSLPPRPVTSLHDRQIIQVACGDHHSLALSKGGELFTWGQNTHGQLGLTFQPPRQSTPLLVEHLRGSPLAQITAGSAHNIALSLSGTVYAWGNNGAGQLGLGDIENRHLPTAVKALQCKSVECVACGAEHTAVLSKGGLLFTFGAGGHGQLGHKSTINQPLPRLVERLCKVRVSQVACGRNHTLACAPSQRMVYLFGARGEGAPENGEMCEQLIPLPMDLLEIGIHEGNVIQQRSYKIVAGGNQSVLLSLDEKNDDMATNRTIATIEAEMPERWLKYESSDHWRRAKKEIKQIFSSVACVNGSFLQHRGKQRKTSSVIPEVAISTASLFFKAVANCEPVLNQISSWLRKSLIPNLSRLPDHCDALVIFLLLPECSLMHEGQDSFALVAEFANGVNKLGLPSLNILEKWWSSSSTLLNKHVLMLKRAVVNKLTSGIATKQDNLNTTSVLEMLEKLYKVNMKANYPLAIEEFYINEIGKDVNLYKDVAVWHRLQRQQFCNESDGPIIFCRFPFILNLLAKRHVFQIDTAFKQNNLIPEAFIQMLPNRKQRSSALPPPTRQCLHLVVSIDNMVEGTLQVLSTLPDSDLRNPLLVQFHGTFPFDTERAKRVLFLHIFEEILQPEYGMFVQCAKFSPLWFPAKPSGELKKYLVFGILCGLTILNCPSMHLPFPLAFFKKLLDQQPTLEDLAELDPVMGRSLQSVLDYEHNDIVDNLDICFIASWDNERVDLIPNGSTLSVDNSNKHDYVNKYVDYVFNKSVDVAFEEFKRGFYKVCEKSILEHFQPQELMGVMVGKTEYDWNKFEKLAVYDGIFRQTPTHPTIRIFWEVFHELPLSEKKKFLLFVVGSDSIPVYGMDCMKITITSSAALTKDHLPQTQTCFQILILPPYSTKQVLTEKLLLAIGYNRGFV
ncbi:E3 ISG15--protein ligase HERC5-like [Ambystoma mexicanum]|uniref:E3 ISG15--protein ligase HERC5-like n=1 Tax=Ambystoma mexicanum TaxID=8296 RepID=UPI0037E76B98